MEKLELFHIHKSNQYDRKWETGKIITVKENFENGMSKRQKSFTTTIEMNTTTGMIEEEYHLLAARIMSKIVNKEIITRKELQIVKYLIEKSYDVSYYANMFKREQALESCRQDKFKSLPSRLHSIFLTDEEGIGYWQEVIGKLDNYFIYRVEVEGNIFKTNEDLIPSESLDYIDTYNKAFKYWHPKFEGTRSYANEYLAQGKIKVLEKLK